MKSRTKEMELLELAYTPESVKLYFEAEKIIAGYKTLILQFAKLASKIGNSDEYDEREVRAIITLTDLMEMTPHLADLQYSVLQTKERT